MSFPSEPGAEIILKACGIMGKWTLSLILGKKPSPWGPHFSVLTPGHSFWWLEPSSAGCVALLSAYNKMSLHFQLIWQTLWVTNAYNCHRLVEDLINGVFLQVQLHEPSWGFSVNAGICPPNGHQGAKLLFHPHSGLQWLLEPKPHIHRMRWGE